MTLKMVTDLEHESEILGSSLELTGDQTRRTERDEAAAELRRRYIRARDAYAFTYGEDAAIAVGFEAKTARVRVVSASGRTTCSRAWRRPRPRPRPGSPAPGCANLGPMFRRAPVRRLATLGLLGALWAAPHLPAQL